MTYRLLDSYSATTGKRPSFMRIQRLLSLANSRCTKYRSSMTLLGIILMRETVSTARTSTEIMLTLISSINDLTFYTCTLLRETSSTLLMRLPNRIKLTKPISLGRFTLAPFILGLQGFELADPTLVGTHFDPSALLLAGECGCRAGCLVGRCRFYLICLGSDRRSISSCDLASCGLVWSMWA
ncbi:hypothetical protein K469DRAFT_107810 [Zopfia rhizophila CBS 207.26]|uniref:Uncharacterized protein n=1 Tax=Zopfia rhizophila CBS 207.26 TaxID=1314779 RepID=A0A6A6E794_9PEZI|nr:hypothetical protein K469DRAFT_107810 [Zopfia rhizophila CBS 207.26]